MPSFPSPTWPADSDHEANVVGTGLPIPAAYSFTGLGVIVQKAIERKTGRTPFIALGSQTERTFDLPGHSPSTVAFGSTWGGARKMPIRPGLVSCSAVAASGQSLVLNKDYRLLPLGAPYSGRPYEMIEFSCPQFGSWSALQITGDWGWADAIDADIWAGALAVGLAYVCKDVLEGIFGSPTMVGAADIKIQQDSFRELGDSADRKAWGDYTNPKKPKPGLLTPYIWTLWGL